MYEDETKTLKFYLRAFWLVSLIISVSLTVTNLRSQ